MYANVAVGIAKRASYSIHGPNDSYRSFRVRAVAYYSRDCCLGKGSLWMRLALIAAAMPIGKGCGGRMRALLIADGIWRNS